MTELIALVDGSTYSTSVCDHAAWIAGRIDASVTVAHILRPREGVKSDLSGNIGLGARTALLEELAELDAAKSRLGQKRGRAILEDAKARIEADGIDRACPAISCMSDPMTQRRGAKLTGPWRCCGAAASRFPAASCQARPKR